jgi:hypothetical protein
MMNTEGKTENLNTQIRDFSENLSAQNKQKIKI